MKTKTVVSKSAEETQDVAQALAKTLIGGDVLTFTGDLGYGKTTFIQGLAVGLGITRRIISPTFMIVRNYRIKNHESRIKNFYHIDLYRVESSEEIKKLGIDEILKDTSAIVAIEWGEKFGDLLPKSRIDIAIEYVNEKERKITVEKLT